MKWVWTVGGITMSIDIERDIANLLIPFTLLVVLHCVCQLCTVLDNIRIFLFTCTGGKLGGSAAIPHLINGGCKLQLLGSAEG